MALPIKETPVLTGKDAEKFIERMNNPKPVSQEEYERAKNLYDKCIERWGPDIGVFL